MGVLAARRKKTRFLEVCICWGGIVPVVAAVPVSLEPGAPAGGFAEAPPLAFSLAEMTAGLEEEVGDQLAGLQGGFSTSMMYDSNVNQSPDTEDFPARGSMVATFSPSLQWSIANSAWTASLALNGGYDFNFGNQEYNGLNYSAAGSVGYDGGRWNIGGRFQESYNDGQNRYFAAKVSQFSHGFGLNGSFSLSPKTSLTSGWNSSWSDPGDGFGGSENHSLGVSAMWRYSPLLRVGPGIRWTRASGETQPGRDSVGPSLSLIYQLSRKVSLQGSLNMQYASYEQGGSDQFLAGGLTASYAFNRLWSFNLSLNRDAQADGSLNGGFRETTALRFGMSRKVRRARLALGLGYEHSGYTNSSQAEARPATDYTTADISLGMPVWGDRASASVFLRYKDSVSTELSRDWSGMQAGCSLNFRF